MIGPEPGLCQQLITVRDCSIYDTARGGSNISEGTWGGHLIERCDVFDTVLETHDHGSFNSWGRDRFWHKDRNYSQREIRVRDGSLALKVGFKNFPMDQFGVKKASLKAITRTPEIPALKASGGKRGGARSMKWLGATLTDLTGEGVSAYGVSQEEGGVALTEIGLVSPAAKAGLKEGDLIQVVDGRDTPNTRQFGRVIRGAKGTIKLKVVRDQGVIEVEVTL